MICNGQNPNDSPLSVSEPKGQNNYTSLQVFIHLFFVKY